MPVTQRDKIKAKYLSVSHKARGREERMARQDVAEFLEMTRDADAQVRREAVGALCPCHVQGNVPEVWDRLIEMTRDQNVKLRRHVRHLLASYRRSGKINVL